MMPQIFSIGDKSGEYAGQLMRDLTHLFFFQFSTVLDLWMGALSSWKILAGGSRPIPALISKVLYFGPSIRPLPSTRWRENAPSALKAPQTMIEIREVDLALRQSGTKRSPRRRQTRTRPSEVNPNLHSSVNMTLSHNYYFSNHRR